MVRWRAVQEVPPSSVVCCRARFLSVSFSYFDFLMLVSIAVGAVPDFLTPSRRNPVPHFLTSVLLNARN